MGSRRVVGIDAVCKLELLSRSRSLCLLQHSLLNRASAELAASPLLSSVAGTGNIQSAALPSLNTCVAATATTDLCLPQDVPARDVAPAFLATLPTTDAVLSALGKAHAARLAIETGKQPVERRVVLLNTLSACTADCSEGLSMICRGVTFSANGQFLAVSFICIGYRSRSPDPETKHGMAVLKVTEGFSEQACITSCSGAPALRWAPAESSLSIAIRGDRHGESRASAEHPAVFVLDAATGATVHALGPDRLTSFWRACHACGSWSKLEWSPSGHKLLVTRHSISDCGAGQNLLSVYDVRQDTVLAQSAFAVDPAFGKLSVIATWHPSSQGLVISHGVQLQAPEAFMGQQLALGVLPKPCVVLVNPDGGGFSPDGQRLLVCEVEDEWEEEQWSGIIGPPLHCHIIMHCQIEGLHIHFRRESRLQGHRPFWLPCTSGVVIGVDRRTAPRHSKITLLGQHQPHEIILSGTVLKPCFSPSRGLMASSSSRGPCIFSLQSGHQVFQALDTQPQLHPVSWLTALAFLPSGRGVICSGTVAGQSIGVCKLHILLFA